MASSSYSPLDENCLQHKAHGVVRRTPRQQPGPAVKYAFNGEVLPATKVRAMNTATPTECLKGIVIPKYGQVWGLPLIKPVFSVFYHREHKEFICLRLAVALLL